MSSHERWFMCDICSFSHLSPHIISQHYKTKHSEYKSIETVIDDCEIKDERTIIRLQESSEIILPNSVKERHKHINSNSSLTASEMTHWYICNECYVSILYTSQIAIIKHYKDEHEIVITAKQVTDDCLINDQKQINQMIEEGRVEGGFRAGTPSNLRLSITPKTTNNRQIGSDLINKSTISSPMINSASFRTDVPTDSTELKSKWGMNHQQNYTSLISRAAQRKFGRSSVSPPPPPTSISRSASSTKFSPDFFKDEESPDAPISFTSTVHAL